MNARFRVLLPFKLHVRADDASAAFDLLLDGRRVTVHPPQRSGVRATDLEADSETPLLSVSAALGLSNSSGATEKLRLDGNPTLIADVLCLDFHGDAFERRQNGPEDPPLDVLFAAANNVLARIRTALGVYYIHEIAPADSFWRVDYLSDEGEPLERTEGLVRARSGVTQGLQLTAITETTWKEIAALPSDFAASAWDTLLLDARHVMPDIGAAVVLAYTALEVLIGAALEGLARERVKPFELWRWINERDYHLKEPSTAEQFGDLLRILSGKSMKDDSALWERFVQLRKARNSFAHEGRAEIDAVPVTRERAQQLIDGAELIMRSIEALLPTKLRRPRSAITVSWRYLRRVEPSGDVERQTTRDSFPDLYEFTLRRGAAEWAVIAGTLLTEEIDAIMSQLTKDEAGLYDPNAIASLALELFGKRVVVHRLGDRPPDVLYRVKSGGGAAKTDNSS